MTTVAFYDILGFRLGFGVVAFVSKVTALALALALGVAALITSLVLAKVFVAFDNFVITNIVLTFR